MDAIQIISGLLSRSLPAGWWLAGDTLAHFVVHRSIAGCPVIHVQTPVSLGASAQMCARLLQFGFKGDGAAWVNKIGKMEGLWESMDGTVRLHVREVAPTADVFAPADVIERACQRRDMSNTGLWSVYEDSRETCPMYLSYRFGTILDRDSPDWWDIERAPIDYHRGDEFFTPLRITEADRTLQAMLDCGARAGIRHAMFPGFGTLLGAMRDRSYVPWDNDLDMCIISDWITADQEKAYFEECRAAGLFETRLHGPEVRGDNGRMLWFSLGAKSPYSDDGVKSCNWFCWLDSGLMWHSKGNLWIDNCKFDPRRFEYASTDQAICKGVPAGPFEKLIPYRFRGMDVQIPQFPGTALDHWYPGWFLRQSGASAKQDVLVIPDWKRKETWHYG